MRKETKGGAKLAVRLPRVFVVQPTTLTDRDLFVAMLDAGAKPNALKWAAKRFKKRHGLADRASCRVS